ncbi:E3 ubiquitin-protein ligase rnf146-like [Tubulanus polymorphus]|uniref:E3 ubiquitin-protein ligase rnf146-like n=1 Tax=Tubulanus polymorphus TaxID=672921 RepID=UPI003DA4FF47
MASRNVNSSLDDQLESTDSKTLTKTLGQDIIPECPVCLQICSHPVQLPCTHIFCFLCIKGVANQSKRCALCRQEIPVDYLNTPNLVHTDDLWRDLSLHHEGYQWYYEGRNGWWQYDQRTSMEIEDRYVKDEEKVFELLIAGFLYIIDLENMIQVRRNDPSRRRRVKRDLATIEKKGIAGIKIVPALQESEREGAYGEESGTKTPPTRQAVGGNTKTEKTSTDSSPIAPNNTPQGGTAENLHVQDLSLLIDNLNISSTPASPPALPPPRQDLNLIFTETNNSNSDTD